MRSREKGKRGERELARWMRETLGIAARRGQQHSGLEGRDVVAELPGIHIEAKRTERLRLGAALAQAVADAPEGEIPTVWHRASRQPWLVTLRAEDALAFALRLVAAVRGLEDA